MESNWRDVEFFVIQSTVLRWIFILFFILFFFAKICKRMSLLFKDKIIGKEIFEFFISSSNTFEAKIHDHTQYRDRHFPYL